MSSQSFYTQLNHADSIRLLELTRTPQGTSTFSSRLLVTQLCKRPNYTALSYVWGERSAEDPILLLDQQPLQIRVSLWQGLNEQMTAVKTIAIWVDQVCIDQDNETEKEQQVQLMSKIYRHARLVIGWLGGHDNDSHLAFPLFVLLGHISGEHKQQTDLEWRRAAEVLTKSGNLQDIEDLYSPFRRPVQAAALLVQRPWFRRLWIVQEVTLASALEVCCGSSSIPGDVFFKAIQNCLLLSATHRCRGC
jgi:hypothetical protein